MSNGRTVSRASLRRIDRWMLLIFGAASLLAGLFCLAIAVYQLTTAIGSRDWPGVRGRVTNTSIEESSKHFKYQGWKTVYDAHVEYEYVVDGVTFHGDQIGFDKQTGSTDRSFAESIAAAYPPGQSVTVYCSPSDPEQAVLEQGETGGSWLFVFVGGVLALVGAGLLVVRHVLTSPPQASPADHFKAPIAPAKEARGLWQDDGALVIDPARVVFPPRCLWTNEPVPEPTEMVLWVTPQEKSGFPRKENVPMLLPVSTEHLSHRAARRRTIGLLLITLGLAIGAIVALAASTVYRNYHDAGISALIGAIGGMVSLLLLIVGIAERFVIPMNVVRGVERGPRGEIVIKRVHPDFIAALPDWKTAAGAT